MGRRKIETYCTTQSINPTMHPTMQNAIEPHIFPCPASDCCAMLSAWRTILISATTRDPKLMLPNEYVRERRAAPLVAPEGIPPGLPAQKNQEPYTPAMMEWMVFFSHSVIQ